MAYTTSTKVQQNMHMVYRVCHMVYFSSTQLVAPYSCTIRLHHSVAPYISTIWLHHTIAPYRCTIRMHHTLAPYIISCVDEKYTIWHSLYTMCIFWCRLAEVVYYMVYHMAYTTSTNVHQNMHMVYRVCHMVYFSSTQLISRFWACYERFLDLTLTT